MKNEIFIVTVSAMFVVLTAFLLSTNPLFTGQVTYGEEESLGVEEEEVVVTREEALLAIEQAKGVMQEMEDEGFSLFYVDDTLIEANRALERADYASILRGEVVNATDEAQAEAREALRLINWENMGYEAVVNATEEIASRRDQAYEIVDRVFLLEREMGEKKQRKIVIGIFEFEGSEIDFANATYFLEQARVAFAEDRYEDARDFLDETRFEIEYQRTQSATLNTIKGAVLFLFQKYWHIMLVILAVIAFIIYYFYRKIKIHRLRKKIYRMRSEKKALLELMKKTQTQRFKKNSISGLVYNIRMKKYQEKTNKIKQQLPVLESRLDGLLGRGGVGERTKYLKSTN